MSKGLSAWRIHDPPWTESYPGYLWISYEEENNVLTVKYVTIVSPPRSWDQGGQEILQATENGIILCRPEQVA